MVLVDEHSLHPKKAQGRQLATKYLGICLFLVDWQQFMNPLITPDAAEALTLTHLPALGTEEISLEEAHGRVLASELRADRPLPPYDRVMMDGICFRKADLDEFSSLTIAGDHAAGAPAPDPLAPGHCWEVMTGACLPSDCDTVLPYEQITRQGSNVSFSREAAVQGRFIHEESSDHAPDDILVPSNSLIDSRIAAVAATVGATTLKVLQRPRVALFTTGDEVVEPATSPAPHQVRQSNAASLRAALAVLGTELIHHQHLPDNPDATTSAVREHLDSDLLLLCGGISKGKYDFVRPVMESLLGAPAFHGVAQRPGKPLAFWPGPPPVFALPGNPMSVQITFHRYVRPFLETLQNLRPVIRTVSLASEVRSDSPFACSLPVNLRQDGATLLADPAPLSNSGDFASAIESDGFIELPADHKVFPQGSLAPFRSWL